jgi:hypothetical protein
MVAAMTTRSSTVPNASSMSEECGGSPGSAVHVPLWKRFRRRSFGPRRPAVFPEQMPLVAVTLLVLALGIGLVAAWLLA